MGLAGRAMGLTLDRVRSFDVVDRRRPAPPRRRRRAVLGAAGRRRELRHRHGRAAAHPQREHRRVLPHQLLPRGPRRGARALGRVRARRPRRDLTAILTLTSGGATAFGQYLGSASALRRLIRPLGGTPTVGSADYLTVQRRWAGDDSPAALGLRGELALRHQAAERERPQGVPRRRRHRRDADPRRVRRRDQPPRPRRHGVPAPQRPLQRPGALLRRHPDRPPAGQERARAGSLRTAAARTPTTPTRT